MTAIPVESLLPENVTRQLRDTGAALPDTTLARLLDNHAGDPAVLEAMIARPSLPPAIVLRLLDLVTPDQRTRLLARHPLPAGAEREVFVRDRGRPAWWTAHLATMFR